MRSLNEADVIAQTAKLLGYARVTKKIDAAMTQAIDGLKTQGRLQAEGGFVHVAWGRTASFNLPEVRNPPGGYIVALSEDQGQVDAIGREGGHNGFIAKHINRGEIGSTAHRAAPACKTPWGRG